MLHNIAWLDAMQLAIFQGPRLGKMTYCIASGHAMLSSMPRCDANMLVVNGRFATKGTARYDNGHVVPYNRFLLLKYNCHLNVEIAVSIRAVKYLYKYISKGHDQTSATVEDPEEDEILKYVNARFLSAQEGVICFFFSTT